MMDDWKEEGCDMLCVSKMGATPPITIDMPKIRLPALFEMNAELWYASLSEGEEQLRIQSSSSTFIHLPRKAGNYAH